MTWYPLDTWTIVIGVLCAGACAIPGAILVLRRMSMMGDAISHTVLPGLAIAFLITQSREPLPMFIGAAVIGVLTAFLVEWVKKLGKTDSGTAMGVVFTILFALGLVLIRRALDAVDLDPGCVLYGDIITAATDEVTVFGWKVPRAVLINGGMFAANLIVLLLFFKEFKISAFDPALATTVGVNARLMHYLLMTMTAATTVSAFETVGSILVIAMLVVPAATAYLLTDKFGVMIALSVVVGAIAAAMGHIGAITIPSALGMGDTITSGMIAFTAGILFVLAWIFAPRHGLLSAVLNRTRVTLRVIREDVLGLLYRLEELDASHTVSLPAAAMDAGLQVNPIARWLAVRQLRQNGKVTGNQGRLILTDDGRTEARMLIRTHRLWESFLHQYLNLPADHVHPTAHMLEHVTDDAMRRDLAESVAEARDPHGKTIPTEDE